MVVRRSKKCMDFTITFHVIHLLLCIIYKAFPVYWEWYVCVILHSITMTLVGEFSCYWREQREINLPSTNRSTSTGGRMMSDSLSTTTSSQQECHADDEDEESVIGDSQVAERTAFLSNTTKEEKAH
nr:unnamed protein product [Naegleria fowleri]